MQGAAQQFDRMLRKLLNRVASEFSPAQFMKQAAAAPEAAAELQPGSSTSAEMELPTDADIAVIGNEGLWLELIGSLTGMVVKHLPGFWQLPQTKLPALAFISQAAKQSVEAGSDAAGAITTNLLFQYNEQVAAAFGRLSTPGADKGSFLAATRRIVSGFTALRSSNPPSMLDSALDQLRVQVLAGAVGQAVAQLEAEAAQLLAQLPQLEDWTPRQALLGGGSAPVSATPSRLLSALEAGMAQVRCLPESIIMLAFMKLPARIHLWKLPWLSQVRHARMASPQLQACVCSKGWHHGT
ncbi:hypothetical protein MMC07_006810 [Pseudocyphellaria aurata]|nr:hypothetical protein [Pseudocyphellaria aurata]